MALCPNGHPSNQAGARFCVTCGAPVSWADEARCAAHPDRVARQPCPRCGTFGCEECLGDPLRPLCLGCRAREANEPLPWDIRGELGTLRAFFQTGVALMFRPLRHIERARPEGSF